MPHINQITVFVASPGDVRHERDNIADIVSEINRTLPSSDNISLRIVRWEDDAYPGYGQDPQTIINGK